MENSIEFDILINDSFLNMCQDNALFPLENKHVLSFINDFEDGSWRYSKFQDFIFNNITETALSQKERDKLVSKPRSKLRAAAENLRLTDKDIMGNGSELAEILLYGIMKDHYNALPVVPKIFYKQNTQDYAKGADSVHIVIENDNDFSLWFGEAKFYNDIEDKRLNTIIESVSSSLQTNKLKKENSIITNISDIDLLIGNNELCTKIKEALSPKNSIDFLKPKIHVPILLLHECSITKNTNCMSEEYKEKIIFYHKERANSYFKKQISKLGTLFKYGEIKFHLILFPVPSKKDIVETFTSEVNFLK
ncbi:HamA C-terminal domain-containing protein [Ornithobacterium rhinotracheale]